MTIKGMFQEISNALKQLGITVETVNKEPAEPSINT